MKAIIYYRKSTDRDDKQANSLEHQLENCRRVASLKWIEVYKEIWESRSAKTEWTRTWFNELIKICKSWKIDYLIIDEPKRLSRNNLDTSRIIDLLDKNQIAWILWTSREYKSDNSRDKFLLQLDLSLSKMDNEDRGKDTKDKMESCIRNTWRFLGKAPYWYKNITIRKWHKDIILDKKEAKLVKEIYNLRIEWKAFTTIARVLKKKYSKKIKFNYDSSRIQRLVGMKFYYGVFKWKGKDITWSHQPIITKLIYDQANDIWKWVHEKKTTILKRQPWEYHLKWFIKDPSWMNLTSYIKKDITYYSHQYRSNHKISINENLLFQKIWNKIKQIEVDNKKLKDIDKNIILDLIKKENWNYWIEKDDLKQKIVNLKNRQNKLLDLHLDEKIKHEIYLSKNNQIENEIKDIEELKENLNNSDFESKTLIMLELAGSYYTSYIKSNNEWKAYITRKLMLELSVDNKKELQLAETPLVKSSKMLEKLYGIPKEFDIRIFKKYLSKINFDDLIEFKDFIKSL